LDTLTAIRSFARPGYCPAKRVRIYNQKWYLVTMQNVETDPRSDYVGLAEGQYVELMPGARARAARDAHLNHCNNIVEYRGPVYALFATRYGDWETEPIYCQTYTEAEGNAAIARGEHEQWLRDVRAAQQRYIARLETDAGQNWLQSSIADCQRILDTQQDSFRYEIRQVRP
jgi:hypothetical protein